MPKPAFIVEGQLEQRMVQAACPGHRVVLLGSNGDTVSMKTIATRIETHYILFSNRYYPIIVMFDREKRAKTVEELEAELIAELTARNVPVNQFVFFISDRDIECLLLCHVSENGEIIGTGCPKTSCVDGLAGESELRKRLSVKSISYHKTTVGMDLFRTVRPFILSTKSNNFRRFQKRIVKYCTWAGL
jgi:hypothetical protein